MSTTTKPKALKTIRSHAGYSRFLYGGELRLDERGLPVKLGEVKRPTDIPSPYLFSAEWSVYEFRGKPVVIAETAHRCFQVFSAEGLTPVTPAPEADHPQAAQIAKLKAEVEALRAELRGKESLVATQWFIDREDLIAAKLFWIEDLEGSA